MLAAATALNYYELMSFITRRGWIQHAQGVGKLLEFIGPNRLRDYPERTVLEASGSMVIAEALAARHRTFLEDEQWWILALDSEATLRTLPFGREYHPLNDLDRLYSKFLGLVERVQSHQASISSLEQLAYDLEETDKRLSEYRKELDLWFEKWTHFSHHVPQRIPSEKATGITRDEEGDLFENVFGFDNVRIAKAFTDHCLMKIATLEWQHTLSDLSWQRGVDHENTSVIPDTRAYALDICRSVDYHLKLAHGQTAAFHISLPCRLAYYALPGLSREAKWLVKVLDTVASSNGVEFARNVLHNVPVRKRK